MILKEWKQHIIEVIPGFVIITFNEKGIFQFSLKWKSCIPESVPLWKRMFSGPLFMMSFRDTLGRKIEGDYPVIWRVFRLTLKILQITKLIPFGIT